MSEKAVYDNLVTDLLDVYNDPKACRIIGHRGSSERYPENTMLAFEKALEEGAAGIETDVHKTADGVFVLIHDATVDRTTYGSGAVSEMTFDEVATLDAGTRFGTSFADRPDTKVPRLDDVLDAFRERHIWIFLQVKTDLADSLRVADMVVQRGMQQRCFLFTHKGWLNDIKTHAPQVLVVNDGLRHDPEQLLAQAVAENWNAVSPGAHKVDVDFVASARAEGIAVVASFLQDDYHQRTKALVEAGCSFILGNDCAAMVAAAKAMD